MKKTIIDTNVIVRYLVNDNEHLYKKARNFFDLIKLGKIRAYLEQTVFTEVIFVLSSVYEIPRSHISKALYTLLINKGILNPEKDVLIKSLTYYAETNLHIVDCVLLAKAMLHNLDIISFDKELLNLYQQYKTPV